MSKFVELRFGQGDMGKSISNRQDVEDGELFIQRELVPIDAIQDMYIILPEKRNIRITFENRGHVFSRIEYYKNEIDCLKRWTILRRACGVTTAEVTMSPIPLPMDIEKCRENRCVICGAVIPEGQQVCPNCVQKEKKSKKRIATFIPSHITAYPAEMNAEHKVMRALVEQEVVEISSKEVNGGLFYTFTFDLDKFREAPVWRKRDEAD